MQQELLEGYRRGVEIVLGCEGWNFACYWQSNSGSLLVKIDGRSDGFVGTYCCDILQNLIDNIYVSKRADMLEDI